jgi:aminopeptidase YwaD
MTDSSICERMLKTLVELDRIGVRFAGSEGEKAAADWVSGQMRGLGLRKVTVDSFACRSFRPRRCEVRVLGGGGGLKIRSEAAAHSPATGAQGVTGPLMVIEKLDGPGAARSRQIGGKVVLIYTSEFFRRSRLQRLVSAKPAAVLVVDDRFTHDQTVAVGFPAAWIDLLGCPFVNISYADAWRLVRDGAREIRVTVEAERPVAQSQNVVGELPGTRQPDEVIVVSAHHDTVINSSGVDDNGSGVACVLELARILARQPLGRTVRFISFGAEEQLSEGARQYVEGCQDLERIQFVLNVDAVGAVMGRTGVYWCGPPGLRRLLEKITRITKQPVHLFREISPFSDHFPFNLKGIPAVWYHRTTYVAARHYHHSQEESLKVISPSVLQWTVEHQAELLHAVADSFPAPFPRGLPSRDLQRLRRMAEEWT